MNHSHPMKHFQIKTDHGYSTPVITNLGDLITSESLEIALEMILPPAQDLGSGTQLNFTSILATDEDEMIYQFTFYSPHNEDDPDYQSDIADILTKYAMELEPGVRCDCTYHQDILTFIVQFYS